MAIPSYRYVNYTDDGCTLHQCLACGQKWEGRSAPEYGWKFCPYCGVKWTGKLECRTADEPGWLYRLRKTNLALGDKLDRLRFNDGSKLTHGWVIESRTCYEDRGEIREDAWGIAYRQSNYGVTTLRMVLAHLGSLRRREDLERCREVDDYFPWRSWTEYRARIVEFKNIPHYTQSTIWQHGSISDTAPLTEIFKKD